MKGHFQEGPIILKIPQDPNTGSTYGFLLQLLNCPSSSFTRRECKIVRSKCSLCNSMPLTYLQSDCTPTLTVFVFCFCKFGNLKYQWYDSSLGQKSGLVSPGPQSRILLGQPKIKVSACIALTERLLEGFTSKLTEVIDKIYILAVLGMKFFFLAGCWAEVHSQFLEASCIPWLAILLSTSRSAMEHQILLILSIYPTSPSATSF